jgi:hypothetical protein
MFGLYFADRVPASYAEVMACDKERFNRFFHAMLDDGVYFAPSAYEAGFVSAAHGDGDIAETIRKAERVRRRVTRVGSRGARHGQARRSSRARSAGPASPTRRRVAAQTYRRSSGWSFVRPRRGRPAGDVPVRVVSSGEPMLGHRQLGFDHRAADHVLVDDDLAAALRRADPRGLDGVPTSSSAIATCARGRPARRHRPLRVRVFELMLLRRNLFPPNGGLFPTCRSCGIAVR